MGPSRPSRRELSKEWIEIGLLGTAQQSNIFIQLQPRPQKPSLPRRSHGAHYDHDTYNINSVYLQEGGFEQRHLLATAFPGWEHCTRLPANTSEPPGVGQTYIYLYILPTVGPRGRSINQLSNHWMDGWVEMHIWKWNIVETGMEIKEGVG